MVSFGRKVGISTNGASVTELRDHNLSLILHTLIVNGSASRAEISRATGLGVTALTKLIRELTEQKLVEPDKVARPAAKGRPTHALAMANHPWRILGVVCDARRIEIVLGTLTGQLEHRNTVNIPKGDSFDDYRPHLTAAIAAAVEWCHSNGTTILAAEAAVPGAVDHAEGVVVRAVLNGWGRVDLRSEINHILHSLKMPTPLVNVDRETNYTILADARTIEDLLSPVRIAYLGGRQAVSGAILAPNGLEHGANGLAGEFGHLAIDASSLQCWCGRWGCVETRLGLAALFSACTGTSREAALDLIPTGRSRMIATLSNLAEEKDPRTLEILSDASAELVRTIDIIAGVVNPSVLLIGGTLAELSEYFEPLLQDRLSRVAALPSQAPLTVRFSPQTGDAHLQGLIEAGRLNIASNPSSVSELANSDQSS